MIIAMLYMLKLQLPNEADAPLFKLHWCQLIGSEEIIVQINTDTNNNPRLIEQS